MARYRHFLRATIVLVVGTSLGLLVGWLVFSVSTLTGKPLFITGGALVGLIVSAIFAAYVRRFDALTLSEITISVPEFAEMKFAINSEFRRVAWKLFIETLTRVATQPLGAEEGSLREALTSLYNLFAATRELLKNMPPSKPTTKATVEMLAIKMLNQEIRPFLSKWHVRLRAFESANSEKAESQWPENAECRIELDALRKRVRTYTIAFGELADVKNVNGFLEPAPPTRHTGG